MSNALLKGRYADLSGTEITPGGGGGGGISGSGVAQQLTYWNGTSSVTGDAGLTYDDGDQILTVAGGITFSDGLTQFTAADQAVDWFTTALTVATNGRYYKTSNAIVKLNDGSFFTAGGEVGSQNLSEIINNTGSGSTASGNTTANRTAGVRLVLLTGGDVLVVGGNASPTTSETWNSGTGTFTARGACTHVEDGGIAALTNGNAVVFGGMNTGTPLKTTQIYDAAAHTFSTVGNMTIERTAFGKSFRVSGIGGTIGKVFVAGGQTISGDQTATTELFNGDTNTWTAKASMAVSRGDSCNVLLNDGRILVAGGCNTFASVILDSVEIYNPVANTWQTVSPMLYARQGAHGIALGDGRVVVAGGIAPNQNDINLPTEIYDPNQDIWSVLCGPLNYTPGSPSDPKHQIYGAELAYLNGYTGIDGVIAIGGKAAAPGTFPATSLREIRHLNFTGGSILNTVNSLLTLKTAYDNQGAVPFIFGTNVNQSFAPGKHWIIQSPEPTFAPLFQVYADSVAEPTYGSGLQVGGDTFRSTAAQNIFNAPTTFGSRTFSMGASNLTIPSDKQVVRLSSTIGAMVLTGTPVIAPGLFEGQRLITIVDSASTGSIQFNIGAGHGIQPLISPLTLQHYGGQDYQEAAEWVWVDGWWKLVSMPIQAAGGTPVWTQTLDSSGINSTVFATSFTPSNGPDSDAVIQPLGTGSLIAQVPDGTTVGGDKRGGGATDFQRYRTGSAQVASGLYSVLMGGQNNTAAGKNDVVVGGDTNTTTSDGSGGWNTIGGGQYNLITDSGGGAWNFIGGGTFNNITSAAQFCSIVGGTTNAISGGAPAWCFIGGGSNNTITPTFTGYASILNGNNGSATGRYGTILGGAWGSDRGLNGRTVIAVGDDSLIGPLGIHQMAVQITRAVTGTNSATPMTTNNTGVVDNYNANAIPAQTTYKVRAEVVAIDQTTGDSKAWTMECLATNSVLGNGIIGSPPAPVVVGNSGVAWTAVLAWDSTFKAVYVEVVGDATNQVSWTATMYTTEVSF